MKIIGMLPVFNDEDIIEEVIEHLLSQDLELVILDNGSNDKTFQICEKFLDKGVLKLEQYKSSTFQWPLIVRKLYDMAIFESPDWVLRSDSDHFLESGIKNLTLNDAISQADAEGYNIIQFNRFDFFMTDNDNEYTKSIKEKLTYYSYQTDFAYRSWKFIPGIYVTGFRIAGHFPIFPEGEFYKIYPKKFVIRHYPFRSEQQAKKNMQDLVTRQMRHFYRAKKISHLERTLNKDYWLPVDHRILTKYNEDNEWNYEKKYTPYIDDKHPTKEELLTNDGLLKNSLVEYNMKEKEELTTAKDES